MHRWLNYYHNTLSIDRSIAAAYAQESSIHMSNSFGHHEMLLLFSTFTKDIIDLIQIRTKLLSILGESENLAIITFIFCSGRREEPYISHGVHFRLDADLSRVLHF